MATHKTISIVPEYCGGEIGNAGEFRMACDAFFRRRGLNQYGGTGEMLEGGMRGIVHASATRGTARKIKRRPVVD